MTSGTFLMTRCSYGSLYFFYK